MAEVTNLTDEEIAKKIQRGDTEQFGELMQRYESKLSRYGSKFLSRPEDISDLVQDVFIKAYEHLQSFDTSLRFSPWIYRIAHNVFINELRRKSKYSYAVFDPDVILPLIPAKERADAATLDGELRKNLDTLVTALPAKYREVVILHYLQDLSYQEISDVLEISVTAVGARMTRAREKLRNELTNHQSII